METIEIKVDVLKCVPYQLCPKCLGNGTYYEHGHGVIDVVKCDVCNGQKIIPMHIITE